MARYLIITEKPSAAKNFAKALGGQTGSFNNYEFTITNLRGHVMTLREPEDMVPESLKSKYKSWQLKYLPWNLDDLDWSRTYAASRSPRGGRATSTRQLILDLKKLSKQGFDALVIATDTDPSGEGELLAWEAIEAIDWRGPVLRANFMDETVKGIQVAMRNLRDVSNPDQDGDYQKGEGRNRWDFASMQLTRIATTAAKKAGYKVVAREGRLKSVIIWKIYEQLAAIKAYVRTPFYEVRFKDSSGHVFSRKASDEGKINWRFASEEAASDDLKPYHDSLIANEKHNHRTQAPGRLLDLAGLAAVLAPRGYDSKEVLATYQKMYEAQVVSYPRTEDKNVTLEQFNELLPLIDQIATVVGVDRSLLTHRQPRPTHVKNSGSHGANRPGPAVPSSLSALVKYGESARAIYEVLAKNYLAMLAEDYHYDHVTAELADYPEFKTAFNVPIAQNFKLVYDSSLATGFDEEETTLIGPIGPVASPFVFEGANQKPQNPTTKWIMAYLEKHNVGTGATRVSTLSDMSRGTKAMLRENKGRLTLTETGNVSAVMVQGTWIASPTITKRLFEMMDQVGRFELPKSALLDSVTKVVEHDMPIMLKNAQSLETDLGAPKPTVKRTKKISEKVSGTWQGNEISISKTWSDHTFTEAEIAQLFAGREISFESKSKRGKAYTAVGKLAKSTYKGAPYVGFKLNPKLRQTKKRS
jgi:DNA topoisomerase-3